MRTLPVLLTPSDAEGEMPVFQMIWFDPSDLGPSYSVFGDTADFRRKLVQAFINAATE